MPRPGFCSPSCSAAEHSPRSAWLHGLAALVGSDEPVINAYGNFMPGCASDDAELRAIADATGGSAVSLCAPDGGANLPLPRTVFPLSRPLGGDGGVTVELAGPSTRSR